MKPAPKQKPEIRTPNSEDGFARDLVNWLLPLYVLLITAGYFVFRSGATMLRGNELSGDRALFSAVNAATLTGFKIAVGPDQFLPTGQVATFVITLLAAFLTTVISSAAVVRIVRLPYSDVRLFLTSAGCCIGSCLLGVFLLHEPDRPALHAAFLGLSAFANSGLHFGPLPASAAWQTQLLLLPLATLGGLGIPVLLEIMDRLLGRRPHLSVYSRTVLSLTAGIYLLGTLACFVFFREGAPSSARRTHLALASTTVLDARTTGLSFSFATAFPRTVQWILIPIMLIGASPASTGGGLKTTTLATLFGGTRRAFVNQLPGRAFGIAAAWLATYLAAGFLLLLALLVTQPQTPADRLLFDLTSALSNAGLSFDILATTGPALYILSAAMFLGRFAPLLFLWWQADAPGDDDLPVA